MTDTLIERAKAALEIMGDDTWSLTPQETYDGRSTTQYYRVMDQNLNAICCEEYGAHCDGGVKKMRLIALAPDLARALIREREAVDVDLIEQGISDVLSEGGTYREAAEYVVRTIQKETNNDK
jgi:hypothetical protein